MSMSPVLSVIMTVYNAENYLGVMLDCIKRQTFRDYELLCVDDGSSDTSAQMLDGAAADDDRITVIHRPNGGILTARPVAFPLCRGEFIGFADSDDFMQPQMYEIMLSTLTEQDADVVWCLSDLIPEGRPFPAPRRIDPAQIRTETVTAETVYTYMFFTPDERLVPFSVWNHIYRADLLRDTWPPYPGTDDFEINLRTVHRARRILLIHEPLYAYAQREQSVIHSRFGVFNVNVLPIHFRAERYASEYLSLSERVVTEYHYNLLRMAATDRFCSYDGPYRKTIRDFVRQNVTGQMRRNMMRAPWHSKKDKLKLLLLLDFPGVCNLARRALRRKGHRAD